VPAIAASGQVYVLNGQLTVTAGPNGYLATGSPAVYIDKYVVTTTTQTLINLILPSGVRGIAFVSNQSLNKINVDIRGHQTVLTYINELFNGSTWGLCQLSSGIDVSIDITLQNNSSIDDTVYFYWVYNLDDFGQWSFPLGQMAKPPLLYGKNTVITNNRVPVRIGDDGLGLNYADAILTSTGTAVLIAAPGAGAQLFIWLVNLTTVNSLPTEGIIRTSSTFQKVIHLSSSAQSSITKQLGGHPLPVGEGLQLYYPIGNLSLEASVYYTVENV